MNCQTPLIFFASTSHTVLKASLSWTTTLTAVKIKTIVPSTVAISPCRGFDAPTSMASTALAAASPSRPLNCNSTSPRAASSPNTRPATAIAMISTGPSEKIE